MNYLHMGLLYQIKLVSYHQILSRSYVEQQGPGDYNSLQLMLPRFFSEEEQTT